MRKITLVYNCKAGQDGQAKFGIETAVDSVVHFQLSGTQDANGVLKIPKTGSKIWLLHPLAQSTGYDEPSIELGIAYAKQEDAFADIMDESKGLSSFIEFLLPEVLSPEEERATLEKAVRDLREKGMTGKKGLEHGFNAGWGLNRITLP